MHSEEYITRRADELKAPWNEHNNLTENNCFQPNWQCQNVFSAQFWFIILSGDM